MLNMEMLLKFIEFEGDILSIHQKINLIKKDMTYMDLSDAIYTKTGLSIHYTTLQKYTCGKRTPSLKTLKAIADYASLPISWFYEECDGTGSFDALPGLFDAIKSLSLESLRELRSFVAYLKAKEEKKNPIPPMYNIPDLGDTFNKNG